MQVGAEGTRVGIWIRVSTEDQVRGESPETHERRARAYAESRDWSVIEVYRLDAVSGKTVKEHPEAKRMLADIESGHIGALIFSKLARLARNTKELLEFAEHFRGAGADLVSLAESIDTSTPAGRLFYTMIAAMAQWEREEIASRVAASVPIRAQMGKPLGGQAPFGYRWVNKELRIDEHEAPVRRLMYELFREHKRKKVVARLLNERGHRTRGGAPFSDTTVDRLLRDPTGKGVRRANYTVSKNSKKAWEFKPKSEWVHFEVEPIVSEELFDEVLGLLDEGRARGVRKSKPVVHLFSGLAFCECGTKMYVPSNTPKYVCKACRNKIPVLDLEHIFREELRGFVFSPVEIDAHRRAGTEQVKALEAQVTALVSERKKAEGDADKLIELYQAGVLDKAGFGSRYAKLGERMKQIDETLPDDLARLDALRAALLSQDEVLAGSRELASRFDTLPEPEKRHIVETIVERVTIGQGEVEFDLLYAPPAPTDVPSPSGSSGPTGASGASGPGSAGTKATQLHRRVALLPWVRSRWVARRRPVPCTIGEHVREERLRRGLQLKQVAGLLRVIPDTVSNWEAGETVPTTRDGPAIVRFLGRNPMPTETLSERLRALRFERGWPQEVAAEAIGISEDRLQDLEAGRSVPTAVRERAQARVRVLLENLALPVS